MVESQHIDEDAVMYGDDSSGGHVFLHDADMLDQPDLFYGGQGMQQMFSVWPNIPHVVW